MRCVGYRVSGRHRRVACGALLSSPSTPGRARNDRHPHVSSRPLCPDGAARVPQRKPTLIAATKPILWRACFNV